MEEYKFIAWDEELGKMSKPFTFGQTLNFTDKNGLGHMKSLDKTHKIYQYIGVQDKNNMSIYSGCIVKVRGTKRVGEYVTFVEKKGQGYSLNENKTYLVNGREISRVTCEIIGHIHTTPELLP